MVDMATKAHINASARYNRQMTKQYNLRLNINTDADVIAKLDAQESKRGYIIELIRRDIRESD